MRYVLPILLMSLVGPALAQDLPPCFERPQFRDPPWVDGRRYCLETVIRYPGELAFSALAAAPDGTLYATRPLAGQVLAITDTDGDALPDASAVVAEGMTLPNGLDYHNSNLYIAASSQIYRLAGTELTLLVDDVPVGTSGWGGSLVVGPDEQIYVSTTAGCDFCVVEAESLGAVLRYTLDGNGPEVVATGLRQPAGLAIYHDELWATDSARTGLADLPGLDEINMVTAGNHFGWPACIGAENRPDPDMVSDFDCETATDPVLPLPTGSTPLGLAAYNLDVLPDLQDTLLIVLNGSRYRSDLQGYAVAAARFDEAYNLVNWQVLIPAETATNEFTIAEMNYRTSGFWPRRPLDVAVSPEGWVYVSMTGGEILAVRPR